MGNPGRNLYDFLLSIEMLSRPQGATIQELQDELLVSRRSVFRLFTTLHDLGFYLDRTVEEGRTCTYRLPERYFSDLPGRIRFPEFKLTQEEALLLKEILQDGISLHPKENRMTVRLLITKLSLVLPAAKDARETIKGLSSIFSE